METSLFILAGGVTSSLFTLAGGVTCSGLSSLPFPLPQLAGSFVLEGERDEGTEVTLGELAGIFLAGATGTLMISEVLVFLTIGGVRGYKPVTAIKKLY